MGRRSVATPAAKVAYHQSWPYFLLGEVSAGRVEVGDFFRMKNQEISVAERLSGWREKYAKISGEDFAREAIEIAIECYLAFAVLPGQQPEDLLPAGVPKAAVISATRFLERPPHRPRTARPAEHAAHMLKRSDVGNEIVHDYLEALLGGTILDPWEFRKRLRACEQRVIETASRAGRQLLDGVTEETLQEQLLEAQRLEAEIDNYSSHVLRDDLVGTVRRRIQAFPRIKAGEFDDLPPLVWIETLRPLGRDLPLSSGGTLKVEWSLEAIHQAQTCAAALVGVPGWYPYWRGRPTPGPKT